MYKALQDTIGTSEKLADLPDFEFRVWVYGLAKADILGRIIVVPKLFKAIAMPLSEAIPKEIERAINALSASKLIHLYTVGDKKYGVYHDHEQSGSGNLKYRKSAYPVPPSGLCSCVQILPDENGRSESERTAVPTAVDTADVLLSSRSSHVPSSPEEVEPGPEQELGPSEKFAGPAARLAIAFLAQKGAATEKGKVRRIIQEAIDFGVEESDIDAALKDREQVKGRMIWDVLKPLRGRISDRRAENLRNFSRPVEEIIAEQEREKNRKSGGKSFPRNGMQKL